MSKKQILISILIISAVLRLYGLSRGDTVNDEVFMSFRGLGIIDFDEAALQTTPWEWIDPAPFKECEKILALRSADASAEINAFPCSGKFFDIYLSSKGAGQVPNIPWWMRLSFHDHPLLAPLAENVSMRIFGENNFAFRLPSALFGVASVYFIYLIGTILYSENAGLIAAALLGVTLNNVYISRTGMQEPYVIFFLLLASYLFLKALREPKNLLWIGVAAGLGAEAKYNSLILVPIFLTYLLMSRRDLFKNRYFWQGVAAFFIIISPTIIYNFMLYKNFGHFDFQFSSVLGGRPEVWKVQLGKEIGSISDRLKNFIPRLIASNSWIFLSFTGLSILAFLALLFKNPRAALEKNKFLLIVICYLLLLLLFIGPSYRFLTMLTPFFALSAAIFLENLIYSHYLNRFALFAITNDLSKIKNSHYLNRFALFAITPFIFFEIFYSYNNQIAYYPAGPGPWLSSKIRYENYNWGYNELSGYLEKELAGKMPGVTFDLKYRFLEKLREKAIERGQKLGLEPFPALLVYEGNFDGGAKLWVLDRLHIYHGWPIISLGTYYDYLDKNGFDYFERSGFRYRYFILQTNIAPSPEINALAKGEAEAIRNKRGDEIFKIYKF